MTKTLAKRVAALAFVAAASTSLRSSLVAQVVPSSGATIELSFGYECGDRFLVRNDGSQTVTVEWKTAGSQDRASLRLDPRQSKEIASASSDAVELWVNGKMVATESKRNMPCSAAVLAQAATAAPSVVVRPLTAGVLDTTAIGNPPSRVARLSAMQGSVSYQASGSSDWSIASLNYTVTSGDRLVSDASGRAELELGTMAVRLGASTDLTVTSLTDGLLQLGVSQGTVRLSVYRMYPSDTIEVDSPDGAISIVAPGTYRIETEPGSFGTTVSVELGRAELSGPNLAQTLEGGRTVRLTTTGIGIAVASAVKVGPDSFDTWSASRDALLTSASEASAAYVNPDIPGISDLEANGAWTADATYGPVWYPTVVVAGWVPYRFGRWGWIEPWGWVWLDDALWGFAPFHYGRWAFLRGRWGWVPGPRGGRPCFAPALVAFADGGGFGLGIGVSAWFPLGPREPFFPWYHHDEHYLRAVNGANVRGVGDLGGFVHPADREHVPYAHRATAMTVVPDATFAGGRPVAHDILKVPTERLSTARLTPHPLVMPSHDAARGGAAAPRPPAAVERRAAPVNPLARGGIGQRAVPPTPRDVTAVQRPLVTRHAAPPASVPFDTRQKAILQHPGRPLEPQQLQNLRAGRPAGPQRDVEPPHPVSPPPRPSAQPPRPANPPPAKKP
jgi:hypothetical protein